MASLVLYGMLTRVRASRQLEEALGMWIDFRWLAEGRSIDHTTFCLFRRQHQQPLEELFVQLGMLAQAAGILKLSELAFDGTKIRANNRPAGKLKTATLAKVRYLLQRKFQEHVAAAEKLDAEHSSPSDDSDVNDDADGPSQAFDQIKSRLAEAQRALAEMERLETAGARAQTAADDRRGVPHHTEQGSRIRSELHARGDGRHAVGSDRGERRDRRHQ